MPTSTPLPFWVKRWVKVYHLLSLIVSGFWPAQGFAPARLALVLPLMTTLEPSPPMAQVVVPV